MWSFSKKEPRSEFDGLPLYDIVPETKGRWNIRKRRYMPSISMHFSGNYYMDVIETYETKTEAEKDKKHLEGGYHE